MEESPHLPWDIAEAKDENSRFINDSALKKYSSTYKIINDKLQQIFSDDSLSENDDAENQQKTRKDRSDTLQGRNKSQICKKPNMQQRHGHGKYIPCFIDETKLNYPKKSSLNAEQQALFLQLMMKYTKKCSFRTPVEEKELKQYELLHDKVVAERFEFVHFVKQRCTLTQDRYNLINPDVKKYIEEVWQHRLSQVSKYAAHYEPMRLLSLVYSDNKRPAVMKIKENLFDVGSSPVIILPKFNTAVNVLTDYSKMRERFPPELDVTRNAHKVPVSQDKLAESFAVANAVHVVISSSGLKRIVDNHPPNYEKTWDLPVIVKEYRQCENKVCKVVYVDKALPPKCLTAVEKNLLFHKFGVKSLMSCRRHQECSRSERIVSSTKDSKSNCNKVGCETEAVDDTGQKLDSVALEVNLEDVELDSSTEKFADAPSKRKHTDTECESDVSTDDNKLVIDCTDAEERSNKKCTAIRKGRKSIAEKLSHSNDEDSHMTRSKARLIANVSYVNQSVGEKKVHFVTLDHEMDSMSSHKDASEAADSSHSEKSLEDITVSNCCDATKNTLCSDVSGSSASINISTGSKQDFSVSKHCSTQEVSEEEQTKLKRVELNLLHPGFNISYRLWKLCKDEGHLEDHKEGFLKGKYPNREIDVLVRCKVDGHKAENKKQSVCVVPKMEYLPEYGAQCLTQSEVTRQWISLYVRPGADLCRVRVNACTSEVMMIEQRSVQEVTQEACQVGRPTSFMLGTLYNVLLGLVDLEAGSYLLSHTPKLGAFVNVLQSMGNGRFNLHDMYIIDTKATVISDGSLWIPIDYKVMTPFHLACKRVPGIFPPTCFVRGKPFSKKKTSTKRHKKKKSK